MKSKRANDFIFTKKRQVHQMAEEDYTILDLDAEAAVELAEEDAEIRMKAEDRERAVKAFQRWCPEYEDGKCVDSSHDTIDCVAANCVCCEEFLIHYDNEQ